MRFIALDVHRDFCEVAIAEGGQVRRAGRVETMPATLELFAQSLAVDDQVVLEATGNALAIARIIEPHVGRVVLANPKAVKNATQTAKTDKLDARTLAKLLAAGFLPEVWTPDEQTRVLRRRISRRRPTSSVPPVGAGWPLRSCRPTSARWSRPACAGSTSSTVKSRRSIGRSPSSCSPRTSCAGC